MIRVCHVIGKMDRAGAETLIMNLFRKIDRTKIQFDFLVHTTEKGAFDEEILKLGGRIFHITKPSPTQFRSYYRSCSQFFSEHSEISIVHGHLGSTAAIYLKAAKNSGKYTIAHSHSKKYPFSAVEIMFRIISYPTRYIADYYMGASFEALQDRYGKKIATQTQATTGKIKSTVLPNSIDTNKFSFSDSSRAAIRTELNIHKDTKVLLNVARLTPVKNQKFLLEAFSQLHQKNSEIVLLLAGAGELEESLKTQAEQLGIHKNIMFLGARNDIEKILSAADVFIITSFYEGFCIAALEAQANGLPCILSDTVPQIVDCGTNVHFMNLKAGTAVWAEEIYKQLITSCSDKSVRKKGAIKVAENGFDISTTVQWLSDFYLRHCE